MIPVVYAEAHEAHRPELYFKAGSFHDHPEAPERATAILAALTAAGCPVMAPDDYGPGPRAAVHTPEYLQFLETAHVRWCEAGLPSAEVVPNVHPGRHMDARPDDLIGQVGYYTTDMSSPIGPQTWDAACVSADVAVHATRQVLDGTPAAYGLCRPPGHHAFQDVAGGFCYLNNVAIAADYARRAVGRVAILDVDVHHGNGTQGIFYTRGDVLTVSLHRDTVGYYPFFAGTAGERGTGDGIGANHNLPLPKGTGDNAYLAALADALALVRTAAPDMLFVALGVDGYEKDPLDGFRLTTGGFERIGAAIGGAGLPTVLIQEGGYNCDDLGANVREFLSGFVRARDN